MRPKTGGWLVVYPPKHDNHHHYHRKQSAKKPSQIDCKKIKTLARKAVVNDMKTSDDKKNTRLRPMADT